MTTVSKKLIVVAALVGLVLLAGSNVRAQLSASQMTFTTIPPSGDYQTVGVVFALAHVPPGILDPSKPFKEAVLRLYPDLATQANRLAADSVVITQIVPVLLSGGDNWLMAFGTAIRTKGQGAAATLPSPTAEGAAASTGDLSGSWAGLMTETGGNKTVDAMLNLASTGAAGEYVGGITLLGPDCEISLAPSTADGSGVSFKTKESSKFSCAFYKSLSAVQMPDGKLQVRIFGSKQDVAKYEGSLMRK